MAKFTANPSLRRQIESAVDRGLAAAVVELQAGIKEMLSRPGGGRIYVKSTARKSGNGKTYMAPNARAMKRARALGIKPRVIGRGAARRFWITAGEANRIYFSALQASSKRGAKAKNIRELGFHQASAPGQPPAPDTGMLRRSWQVGQPEKTGTRRVHRLGSNVKYARRMEFGGTDKRGITILPRPYVAPTIARYGPKAVEAFRSVVAGTLAAGASVTIGRSP